MARIERFPKRQGKVELRTAQETATVVHCPLPHHVADRGFKHVRGGRRILLVSDQQHSVALRGVELEPAFCTGGLELRAYLLELPDEGGDVLLWDDDIHQASEAGAHDSDI